jgi:hypothetical protein
MFLYQLTPARTEMLAVFKAIDLPNNAEIQRILPNMLKLAENRRRLPKGRKLDLPVIARMREPAWRLCARKSRVRRLRKSACCGPIPRPPSTKA